LPEQTYQFLIAIGLHCLRIKSHRGSSRFWFQRRISDSGGLDTIFNSKFSGLVLTKNF